MQVTIDITGHKETVLDKIVEKHNIEHPSDTLTATEFVTNIIDDYIVNAVRGRYQSYFNNLTIQEMVQLIGTGPLNL